MGLKYVIDAGLAFLLGMGWGMYSTDSMVGDTVDVIESITSREYRKRSGLTDEGLKDMRTTSRKLRLAVPAAIAGIYSLGTDLFSGLSLDNFNESMTLAMPGAYLGSFVGRRVRDFRNRRIRKYIRLVNEGREDIMNMNTYLLSQEESDLMGQFFVEMESNLLKREDVDQADVQGPMQKAYSLIHKKPRHVQHALLYWVYETSKKMYSRVKVQRKLMDFYERELLPNALNCAVMSTSGTRIRIFTREGDRFYVQHADFTNLMGVGYDVFSSRLELPEIITEESGEWEGDYKELSDRILKEDGEYSILLVSRQPGLPDNLAYKTLMSSILNLNILDSFASRN